MLIMNLGSDGNICAAYVMIFLQKHCKLGCCLFSEALIAECNDGSRNDMRTASQNVAILTCCEIHTTQQQFTSAEYVCSTLSSGNHPDHPDLTEDRNYAICRWSFVTP